jgi:hypothetical protein
MTTRGVLTVLVGVGMCLQLVGWGLQIIDGGMTAWRWTFAFLSIVSGLLVLWGVRRIKN